MLSGVALTASSVQAARFGERHGITHAERAAIARSQANLNALRERARINAAQARHGALVARYRYN